MTEIPSTQPAPDGIGESWFIVCTHLLKDRSLEKLPQGDPPEGWICPKCRDNGRPTEDLMPLARSSLKWLFGKDH